jgi:hypothetical protein
MGASDDFAVEVDVDIPARLNAYPSLSGDISGAGLPLNVHPQAYTASLRVFNGAGNVLGFTGYNSGAAAFVQWFDSDKLPADGAVPDGILSAAATSNFAADWGQFGRHFTIGCWLVYSSTGPTKTIGTAACWFDAQFV